MRNLGYYIRQEGVYYMKFLDDYNKEVNWYNKNYYFLGTVIVVGVMFLFEYLLKDEIAKFMTDIIYFNVILSPLIFSNIMNLVVSAVCIGLVSLFLEKYWGTIRYLVTMIVLLVAVAFVVPELLVLHIIKNPEIVSSGLQMSTLVYGVFALALVEILFHPKKHLLDKVHSFPAYGVIILIVAIMCVLLPATYNDDMAAYFKEVKFTAFEPLTKNAYYWFSSMVGGVLGIVTAISAVGATGGFGGGYPSGGGGSKKKGKDDTGLTFADIMEKEKEAETPTQSTSTESTTPTNTDVYNSYVTPSAPSTPAGGYASGYIGTTPPQSTTPANTGLNSIFSNSTTDNKDRVVVGETVKQYSDYNQYINEKMKNLNNKAGGNK